MELLRVNNEIVYDVAIVDYSMGNLFSIQAACSKVGLKSIITSNSDIILSAKSVILPGVGAFGEGMNNLRKLNLHNCLKTVIDNNTPLIGICLGMQLLFTMSSEFGNHSGLNFIDGEVLKFNFNKNKYKVPIPHVGWNKIQKVSKDCLNGLLNDNNDDDFMYFVHSFYVIPKNKNIITSYSSYYGFKFCSSIQFNNITAFQFHPEKSSYNGLKIYESIKNQF
jgi:imidazole glycerol-phosphate synthase subunit HisH